MRRTSSIAVGWDPRHDTDLTPCNCLFPDQQLPRSADGRAYVDRAYVDADSLGSPSAPRIGGDVFRYRLHSPDGDDLGEATYAIMIKPGEEILLGAGRRFPRRRRGAV
jgi:hypothetical protein